MVCVSFCVICIAERLVSSVICRFQGLSYSHVPECIEFSFILFIHHYIHFYFELCTYCNILDIYLSWNMNSVQYLDTPAQRSWAYWFSVTSFSKWLPGGHIRFFGFWMAWFRQRNSSLLWNFSFKFDVHVLCGCRQKPNDCQLCRFQNGCLVILNNATLSYGAGVS